MSMLASDWLSRLSVFSFHQHTVEFGPTHIFTQIYAPAAKNWSWGTLRPRPDDNYIVFY